MCVCYIPVGGCVEDLICRQRDVYLWHSVLAVGWGDLLTATGALHSSRHCGTSVQSGCISLALHKSALQGADIDAGLSDLSCRWYPCVLEGWQGEQRQQHAPGRTSAAAMHSPRRSLQKARVSCPRALKATGSGKQRRQALRQHCKPRGNHLGCIPQKSTGLEDTLRRL